MSNVLLPLALYMCLESVKEKKKNKIFMCDFILFLTKKKELLLS